MTANDQPPEKQSPLDFNSTGEEAESFETLFDELETIAHRLEDGALNFEQSNQLLVKKQQTKNMSFIQR